MNNYKKTQAPARTPKNHSKKISAMDSTSFFPAVKRLVYLAVCMEDDAYSLRHSATIMTDFLAGTSKLRAGENF